MMFSSIRSRLTLWYIGVLAIVFTAFAAATYALFVRVLQDETKTNINEMAGNFVTSVNQLRSEKGRSTPPDALIRESLEEFRFRDYQFASFSQDNKLVGRTIETDLPPRTTLKRPGNARPFSLSLSRNRLVVVPLGCPVFRPVGTDGLP